MNNDQAPEDPGNFFRDTQIAAMLGVNPVTVRQWRVKNREAGRIQYGPPYEYRGRYVVYPKPAFRAWCAAVKVVDGVPHMNLPVSYPAATGTPLAGAEEALGLV